MDPTLRHINMGQQFKIKNTITLGKLITGHFSSIIWGENSIHAILMFNILLEYILYFIIFYYRYSFNVKYLYKVIRVIDNVNQFGWSLLLS